MERALARDKGVEITELRAKQATINDLNDEMLRKLQEEKSKFDKLKYDHITLAKQLENMNTEIDENKAYIQETDTQMKVLQEAVEKLDINVT